MQAALITGQKQVAERDFPEPEAVPDAAVLRVDFSGICGTDVAAYRSGQPYAPSLCGHEWAGTVTAVGAGVSNIREGDRAVMAVPVACGQCTECRNGHTHRCAAIMALAYGIHPLTPPHGGYAPRIAVPADCLAKVPPALSTEQAAMVEPATVAPPEVSSPGTKRWL